jgi:hypothetical protein
MATSGEPGADDLSPDIGEAKVAALKSMYEFEVVHAKAVEHGGVQIVDVDGVFGRSPSDFVGLAVDPAALDSAASKEGSECEGMMVATGVGFASSAGETSHPGEAMLRIRIRFHDRRLLYCDKREFPSMIEFGLVVDTTK